MWVIGSERIPHTAANHLVVDDVRTQECSAINKTDSNWQNSVNGLKTKDIFNPPRINRIFTAAKRLYRQQS